MTYEHPAHKRPDPKPAIELEGWDKGADRPKPLEGQTHLFTNRTEPAKRKKGESPDQETLF